MIPADSPCASCAAKSVWVVERISNCNRQLRCEPSSLHHKSIVPISVNRACNCTGNDSACRRRRACRTVRIGGKGLICSGFQRNQLPRFVGQPRARDEQGKLDRLRHQQLKTAIDRLDIAAGLRVPRNQTDCHRTSCCSRRAVVTGSRGRLSCYVDVVTAS